MKKYISIFLLTLASCNVLDQESVNDVAFDDVFKSKEGAYSALTGMYNTMQARDYYGGYYPMIADLYSDIGASGGFDNIALDEISVIAVTPSNLIVQNTWLAIYNTIATANAIIAKVPDIEDPDFSDEDRNNIIGQAHAVRALAHFDLLRMFGEHWDESSEYGIPVVTTIQSADDVVTRGTVAETYEAILGDLDEALAMISEFDRSQSTFNPVAVKAIRARVNLYKGNLTAAANDARDVIDEGSFSLLDAGSFKDIYTERLSPESVFELTFDVQNRSAFNSITFSRADALRTEVLFLAESSLNDFFASRPGDLRADLVDFNPENNSSDIIPDGRSQKYRGEATRDNPAFIVRIAEMYLILAEAAGYNDGGLDYLNELRNARGLGDLEITADEFEQALLDERKAELNFEGHRMFDLARTGVFEDVMGAESYQAIFPIPLREILATKGAVTQNPGYSE